LSIFFFNFPSRDGSPFPHSRLREGEDRKGEEEGKRDRQRNPTLPSRPLFFPLPLVGRCIKKRMERKGHTGRVPFFSPPEILPARGEKGRGEKGCFLWTPRLPGGQREGDPYLLLTSPKGKRNGKAHCFQSPNKKKTKKKKNTLRTKNLFLAFVVQGKEDQKERRTSFFSFLSPAPRGEGKNKTGHLPPPPPKIPLFSPPNRKKIQQR